jgi:hypothetical protein
LTKKVVYDRLPADPTGSSHRGSWPYHHGRVLLMDDMPDGMGRETFDFSDDSGRALSP